MTFYTLIINEYKRLINSYSVSSTKSYFLSGGMAEAKGISWRKVSLHFGFLQLFISCLILIGTNFSSENLIIIHSVNAEVLFSYTLGYDALSLLFVILTSLIYIICVLLNWNLKYKVKEYLFCLFIIDILIINTFFILDFFLFYIYFESILIPMFLLIGVWGSRERKIQAAYKFFLYTLFGSLFMLLAILNLYYHVVHVIIGFWKCQLLVILDKY